MFHLRDFFHHPAVREIVEHLRRTEPGLILITGGEGLPNQNLAEHLGMTPTESLLPSGRGVIFRALMEEMLEANPEKSAVRVCGASSGTRGGRQSRSRMTNVTIHKDEEMTAAIHAAVGRQPDLLFLEALTPDGLPAALTAAANRNVLGQIESPFPARAVPQAFRLTEDAGWHPSLRWVMSVQRLPALCPHCRKIHTPSSEELTWLEAAFTRPGVLGNQPRYEGNFYSAEGCERCQGSGRSGDVALLEAYHHPQGGQPQCRLSYEQSIWHLVQDSGKSQLSLSDLMLWQVGQNNRTYQALTRAQQALELSLKKQYEQRAEIEAAQRVLEQRTQALFSLQGLGQALISSDDLIGLGRRICKRAAELCGGDLAVLYYSRPGELAEVLAVSGWPEKLQGQLVQASRILNWSRSADPAPYQGIPPGLQENNKTPLAPTQGLYVPLIAQNSRVGALVLQSIKPRVFQPVEVALLKTFGNQAALALQRAVLVEELRGKIRLLEEAQVELANKERMESEMELARQVQQSMLPRSFPDVTGLAFAVRYEAARQVGGDFYDVIALPNGQIGLAIADVSDKGMPAALYMALTRSLLLAEAQRQNSPAQVLLRVNQLLHDVGSSGMFVTIFYAVLDPVSGSFRYSRAGHDRPILLRENHAEELNGRGLPLGIFTGNDYYLEEHTSQLQPGDRLVLYSDGLTDAHAPEGELFGREHLLDILNHNALLPAEKLCDKVFTTVLEHQADQSPFDDMTLLIIQME